jgi:hypothetical protein
MSKKDHHHGENVHKMNQLPEKPATSKSPDLLIKTRGNIPPADLKRITHKTTKRQAKKNQK